MSEHETNGTNETIEPTRRTRAGRKRASFRRLPPPAPSVRGLWLRTSDEERAKAHRLCMEILEYWLGRASKEEIAERLETSPLRVWQLSQQALSGMLVGLLRVPRSRGKLEEGPALPGSDTTSLRQRIAGLEKKLARTEDLVRVLKHLPWERGSADGGRGERRPERRRKKRATAAKPRAQAGDRELAAREPTSREAEEGDDGARSGDAGS